MDGSYQPNHHQMGYDPGIHQDLGMEVTPGGQAAADHLHSEMVAAQHHQQQHFHQQQQQQHQQFNSHEQSMEIEYNQHHQHPHGIMLQNDPHPAGNSYTNGRPDLPSSVDKNVLLVVHNFLKKHKLEVWTKLIEFQGFACI